MIYLINFIFFILISLSNIILANDNKIILTFTDYEKTKFCSSILKENIFACQFHPEKSGLNGIKLIKNLLKYDK